MELALSQHMLKARALHNYAMKEKDRAQYPPISQIVISMLRILILGASSLHPNKRGKLIIFGGTQIILKRQIRAVLRLIENLIMTKKG